MQDQNIIIWRGLWEHRQGEEGGSELGNLKLQDLQRSLMAIHRGWGPEIRQWHIIDAKEMPAG